MFDDEIYITHNSEKVALDFNLTHQTIVKWIKDAIKNHPQLESSFQKTKENKRIVYIIEEAGYSYLCNRYHGIKPASREYFFKESITPFLNELGYEVEYQKTILKYRVDFYIPELNMVIEHDEEYHRQIKVSQYDIKKEKEIVKAKVEYVTKPLTNDKFHGQTNTLLASLNLGLQSNIGKYWRYSLSFGLGYGRNLEYSYGTFYPAADIKVSYVIPLF